MVYVKEDRRYFMIGKIYRGEKKDYGILIIIPKPELTEIPLCVI